jgi:hypothetical protein
VSRATFKHPGLGAPYGGAISGRWPSTKAVLRELDPYSVILLEEPSARELVDALGMPLRPAPAHTYSDMLPDDAAITYERVAAAVHAMRNLEPVKFEPTDFPEPDAEGRALVAGVMRAARCSVLPSANRPAWAWRKGVLP